MYGTEELSCDAKPDTPKLNQIVTFIPFFGGNYIKVARLQSGQIGKLKVCRLKHRRRGILQ